MLSIPAVLQALSAGGAAGRALAAWGRSARGDARALVFELRDNHTLLDLVAGDEVTLDSIIEKLSTAEYERLAKAGYNFNALKRGRIRRHRSLEGTSLSAWQGKETAELIDSIYMRIRDLKLRYPLVKEHEKYRWGVRVNNIRKRTWLLLRHVNP